MASEDYSQSRNVPRAPADSDIWSWTPVTDAVEIRAYPIADAEFELDEPAAKVLTM
jgi:hypothetical protein